ncbi:structural protein [Maridesulfovibrio ferrireducens]|uniref:structural protein n=1 Tax=Maridesulfovibrio ferrireducens TaxID=246191 RepID=UPI001A1F9679|nr:structural protein [Maridesulfovibrio ferrireducens]MBI9109907.1 structural protein [Maridesulfovibrio ferrireducens]
MSEPRGIRNHNPGNIRHGAKWNGLAEEQLDKSFCTFKTPEHGIRAMGKILITYQDKYGLDTVSGIIDRWAPPIENDTNAYAEHVAKQLEVGVDEPIVVRSFLDKLCTAIIRHENGVQPYDIATVQRGVNMAMGVA